MAVILHRNNGFKIFNEFSIEQELKNGWFLSKAEAKADIKAKTEAKVEAEAKADIKAKTEAKVEAKPKVEVRAKTEAKVEAKPKVEVRAKTEIKR